MQSQRMKAGALRDSILLGTVASLTVFGVGAFLLYYPDPGYVGCMAIALVGGPLGSLVGSLIGYRLSTSRLGPITGAIAGGTLPLLAYFVLLWKWDYISGLFQ